MNYLEKLLDGAKVEWQPLGEISDIKKGTSITRQQIKDGNIPVVAGGKEPAYFHNVANRDKNVITVSASGANSGFVNYFESPIFASDCNTIVSKDEKVISTKFVYEFLKSIQDEIYKLQRGQAQPHVYAKDLAEIQTPIPYPENPEKSLAIQAKIARILDTFSALTAELTAELTMRKKQYNYYRDKLFTFPQDCDIEWEKLGQIAKIKHGKDWKKLSEGNVPVYGSGGIMGYVNTYSYDKPAVLIPRKGSITNIFYVDTPFWNVDTIYYTEIDTTKIVPKYLYYYINTVDIIALDTGSGRPSLTQAILNKLEIPVPFPNDSKKSLAEQARIVDTLDKFDALTTSISEGLPREIELSQKRYEYYRDLLLSFPKP